MRVVLPPHLHNLVQPLLGALCWKEGGWWEWAGESRMHSAEAGKIARSSRLLLCWRQ